MLNTLFNTLAYQPRDGEQSYLFWGSWLAHNVDSSTDLQDAQGPIVQGEFLASCSVAQPARDDAPAGHPVAHPDPRHAQRAGLVEDQRQLRSAVRADS